MSSPLVSAIEHPTDPAYRTSANAEHQTLTQTERASSHLDSLTHRYRLRGEPVPVAFRNLIGPLPAAELTHTLHPYPARLLRQVPRFFLNCDQLVQPGDLIMDPFCGSGTVLVEAMARGLEAWGIDSNPFARLLTQVKTTPISTHFAIEALDRTIQEAKSTRARPPSDVVNVNRWYSPAAQSALQRFGAAIAVANPDVRIRHALLITHSLAADKLSLRDRRIPVPVLDRRDAARRQTETTGQAWAAISAAGRHVADRVGKLPSNTSLPLATGGDVRSLRLLHAKAELKHPRLAITSPPYGAAQKYIRSTSLSLGWLKLARPEDLAALERHSIGREHMTTKDLNSIPDIADAEVVALLEMLRPVNPTRSAIYAHYFFDMTAALAQIFETLAPGGHLVLIAGANTVAGLKVETHALLCRLAISTGFLLTLALRDEIRGRVLMTRRAASAGSPITEEHVYLFRKP